MSGSGISWAMCKSAPRSRQITTPVPHHSCFLQAGCPSCCPANSVKALTALSDVTSFYFFLYRLITVHKPSVHKPSVLRHCLLGIRKSIQSVKIIFGVMQCWCGYLSGARCRLFAYGPSDATASPNTIIFCLI